MFAAPSRAALPIFTDEDSKPHAGVTVAVLAALTQFQHAITQFVPYHRRRSRRLLHHFPAQMQGANVWLGSDGRAFLEELERFPSGRWGDQAPATYTRSSQ